MTTETRTDPIADEAEPSPDGRRQRSERSRRAIVDALLGLLREGHPRPSSALVAERAGVTARTIFNHFGDMEGLLSAAAAAQLEHVRGLRPRPPQDGDRRTRVRSLADQLAVLFEDTMHVRWAVLSVPAPNPAAIGAVRTARAELRATIAGFLAPELAELGEPGAGALLDRIDPVCDPLVWRLRRLQQGLDLPAARRQLADTVEALVDHALATAGDDAATPRPSGGSAGTTAS